MPCRLLIAVELPLHGRDIDDVFVAVRRPEHERLESGVEDERRHGIDELHFEQLHRGDLGQQQSPRVPSAQVDLLEVLVQSSLGEKIAVRSMIVRQQRYLR